MDNHEFAKRIVELVEIRESFNTDRFVELVLDDVEELLISRTRERIAAYRKEERIAAYRKGEQ